MLAVVKKLHNPSALAILSIGLIYLNQFWVSFTQRLKPDRPPTVYAPMCLP
jgi:hypothetical protein